MPVDGDDEARRFWRDTIGLTEVPKPEPMAGRGGCWLRAFDDAGATVVTGPRVRCEVRLSCSGAGFRAPQRESRTSHAGSPPRNGLGTTVSRGRAAATDGRAA